MEIDPTMKSSNLWARSIALVAVALLVATGAYAQLQTGNLYGTVKDQSGAALPGVTITLSGQGAPQIQVTNAQGQFHFLGLSPGSYDIKAELEGFSTVDYPNISINIARNTSIEVKLQSAVEETITVTAESPLLDERRISTGATVAKTELEKIPTARDPWAILQTTPGVLTDRINVGGNQSGQQSTYVGPGSTGDQAVWAVDGVVITDMAATGSSPAYYDFDAFEEMQVSTGGSDASLATPGVSLNMVTKRGTNEWRGSGRFIKSDNDWQSNTGFDNNDLGRDIPGTTRNEAQTTVLQGNHIVSVQDWGAEIGGPIVKDRLWIWGSYGENKIDLLTAQNFPDKTTLKSYNGKLNGQIAASNSATGWYFNSDKVKIGRNASLTRPPLATWDQSHFGPKPTAWKLEDTQIFNSNVYLTGMYSKVNGGFDLIPEGGFARGVNEPNAVLDVNAVWQQTYLGETILRPQTQYKADSSVFFNTGTLAHELKFGAGYRKAETTTLTRWPGIGIDYYRYGAYFGLSRDGHQHWDVKYDSLYAQDTLTVGNLTANVGLRYDKQDPKNLPTTIEANSFRPDLLPAVNFPGNDPGFTWTSITPRLGLTYALGADRKTLLRASYSRFADQLGGLGSAVNPTYGGSYVYFYYNDLNGNQRFDPTSDTLNGGIVNYGGGYNPVNPSGWVVNSKIDPGLDAPTTDEILLSAERALLPEFVVGVDLTWRKYNNYVNTQRLVFDDSVCPDGGSDPYGAACINSQGRVNTPSDYVTSTQTAFLPDGTTRQVLVSGLRPGVSTRNGSYYYNSDISQDYRGVSLVANKRLANRWMMRGNVTWSDWTWNVPGKEIIDPERNPNGVARDGDIVLQGAGNGSGSFGNVFLNSKWSYTVNGMYQVAPDRPWGFNVAGNITGRQGYPLLYYQRFGRLGTGMSQLSGNTTAQVTGSDEFRNPNIHTLDLRLEKEFTFSDIGLTLGFDCFNVTNEGFVLQRQGRLNTGNSNWVTETLSPRIYRIGARLSFR